MKVTFDSAKFLSFYLSHPCSMARKITSQKHSDKILMGVRNNGVAFLGTGENQSYERIVPAERISNVIEGAIAIDANKLLGVVKTYGDKPVTLELTDKNILLVKSGRSRVMIREIANPDEYAKSSVALVDSRHVFFQLSTLKAMIETVKHSMPTDSARGFLNCMNLIIKNGIISLSSTDGYRLGIAKHPLDIKSYPELAAIDIQCLIPPTAIGHITSLTAETDDCIIQVSEKALAINVCSLKYQTALVDARYPDLNAILPQSSVGAAVISKSDILSLIERAKISMVNSKTGESVIPRLEMEFHPDGCIETACGKANNQVAQEAFQALQVNIEKKVSTAMDYRYLALAVGAMKSDDVILNLGVMTGRDSKRVCFIITPATQHKISHMALLLPMN